MNNKVILVVLAFLVVIAGGTAYYSYTLNQHLDDLGQALAAYRDEQAGRLSDIGDGLSNLDAENDTLSSRLTGATNDIASLGGALAAASNRASDIEKNVAGIAGQLNDLAGRLAATEADISSAMFNPGAVYRTISPATVRITDGGTVIGSGFIYDSQRHVVTAYHVIEGLNPIIAITADGRLFDAEVTGYSQISDVAVLELSGDPAIAPVVPGDSSRIQIGEPVAAIGSPLDIRDTLTAGVISQVNRYTNYGTDDNWVPNLLQFDAPVNPGNSGGPLANASGQVIGVVVARIVAGTGDGIYYAVASNKFKRVADAIIAGGSFPYPWIGVNIADLTPDAARAEDLETVNGVDVSSVDSSGPAQAAGLLAGDIILAIDGAPVRDTAELTSYLGENLSPGDEAVIEVLRGSSRLELTVVIGRR
jgi:S1-C subfamily serine protease